MPSALNIEASGDFSTLLAALIEKPRPDHHDVERLRLTFYREGAIDRRRAAEIVHANRRMRKTNDKWIEFYLEVLADFFLEYQRNFVSLPVASEEILLSWLGHGSRITDPGERRLVLRLFLKANDVSARFEAWMLHTMENHLLHHQERWAGQEPRSPGVIDALDMQLIRRLVRGDGDCCRRTVSNLGTDFLRSLDRNAREFTDPERWRRLMIESLEVADT